MATSSLFTNIRVKDRTRIRKLVRALERSKASKAKVVEMRRTSAEMTETQIKSIFGAVDERIQDSKP